ncbi:hypothetical protein [Microcella frigidaquae]|uniref:Uncharacterized protein n=1 Tax=Microcella frigidaquae TaxID=424758 RepID=A0A840XMJ3_9MICO|nr:hypothetical protein [Microcella frigidaquae]MBB5617838.1 hypothetical protein [Microcella frigidaquae]NHN45837.1 hypothetical protein [Microcella frigidaquae]
MAAASSGSGGLDPRYPEAFQRGGAASAPVVDDPAVVRGAAPAAGRMPAARRADRPSPTTPIAASAPVDGVSDGIPSEVEPGDVRYAELVVAGNPWLRTLWVIGGIAIVAGFALTIYAELAFSAATSGIYDPSVYIVPRIAEALAQPLVIAGVLALVAETALQIVAWRPSAARAVPRD